MQKAISTRLTVVLLAMFTLAAIIFASLNLVKDAEYQKPTDGIWWMEAHGGLQAQRVPADSPGERAGIKAGDVLLAAAISRHRAWPAWCASGFAPASIAALITRCSVPASASTPRSF